MFTESERSFLSEVSRGRLSTLDAVDWPQIHPVAFVVDAEQGTIDVVGPNLRDTDKYRNVRRDPRVTITIDDPAMPLSGTDDRQMGRGIVVRGLAEAAEVSGHDTIRIRPVRIDEWNLDAVGHRSRFVE